MKIIAIVYLSVMVFILLLMPLLFGKERKPYNYQDWLGNIIINLPLFWLLYKVFIS